MKKYTYNLIFSLLMALSLAPFTILESQAKKYKTVRVAVRGQTFKVRSIHKDREKARTNAYRELERASDGLDYVIRSSYKYSKGDKWIHRLSGEFTTSP